MRASTATGLASGLLAILLLAGCPQTPAPGGQGGDEAGQGSAPPPGVSGSEGHPDDARWKIVEGQSIEIQGTLSYPGELGEGTVRIDVLTKSGDSPPHLVSAETLAEMGPFIIQAPANFGEVHLVAFIDRNGDGPSSDDAAATTKLTLGAESVTDVVLALSDTPDLGELAPGAPPTGEEQPAGPPPPEGAPEPEADGPPPAGAPTPETAPTPEDAPPTPEGAPPSE